MQRQLLFYHMTLLSIMFLSLVACNTQTTLPYTVKDPASLETNSILSDPLAEQILRTMFIPERDISADGAVGLNQHEGYVNIRPQADGSYLALALGISVSDKKLIERGVRALEFGLPYQNPDGTFQGSSEQDIARFCWFGLRSYNLLDHSIYQEQYSARLTTVFSALLRTGKYLLEIVPRHPEIFESCNQVAMLSYVLTICGQKAGNDALIAKGELLLQAALTMQRDNGAFSELGGQDSHYQAVSLMVLTNIYIYTTKPSHQQAIYPALLGGYQWESTRILSSGHIIDEGNTRTANDPADSPEGKQINHREIAMTLLYLSYLGDEFAEARDLSKAVLENFQKR